MSSQLVAASYPQICDANDNPIAVLQNAYDVVLTDQLLTSSAGQEVLDFNIPYDAPNRTSIVNERMVVAGGSKFRVRTAWDGWDQGSPERVTSVHCEALWYSDLGEATPLVISATNATTALTTILAGTGWTVGTVNPTTGSLVVLDFTNPLALLRMMPDAFGGELILDSFNKIVHLVTHRGSTTPVTLFGKGKNLASNSRSVDTTNLITRLYVVGGTVTDPVTGNQTVLNLRAVNGGLDYIENYSYYDTNGLARKIRTAIVTADDITDAAKLLAWGQAQLAVLSQPAYTYNVQQTNTGSFNVAPVLGDAVRIYDASLGMDIVTRVETRNINLIEPQRTSYTVGTTAYDISNLNIQSTDPVTVDTTTQVPVAPASVVISTQHATATDGTSMMAVLASWAQVTANTDGTPASIESYRIEWQAGGAAYQPLNVSGVQTSAMLGIVSPGLSVGLRIAAVSYAGVQSAWTVVGSTLITTTATVPNQPSTPTLDITSAPGVIIAAWNGLDSGGAVMAANFLRTEVHVSTVSGFTPTTATRVDELYGPGRVAIGSVVYGTTYYVRLITLNTDLVSGPVSVQASAVVRQIVNTDLITDAVDNRLLADNAVAQANIQDLAVGTAEMINLSVVNAKIGTLAVNDAKVNDLAVGKITSGVINTAQIQLAGGKLTTSATGTGARLEFDGAGIRAYDSGNNQLVNINATTGSITATGQFATASVFSVGGTNKAVVMSSTAQDRITLYTGAGSAEHAAPFISGQLSGGIGTLRLSGPALGVLAATTIDLTSTAISGSTVNAAIITAQALWLSGGINFYCDAFLDLTNQTNSGFFQTSTGVGTGDKIGLFGSGHGIGIGASKTVIYVGSSANVSIMDGTLTSPRSNSTGYRPILASAFTVSSLESTKTRIKTMPDGALDKLMKLRPVIARSHNDTHLPDSIRDRPWLVAEEVAQVDRSLAAHQMTEAWSSKHMHKEKPPKSGESDVELVGVDLMQVVALQTKAIQELLIRVETQAEEITELRERVEAR